MADYHILTGDGSGNAFTVVHHIAIPGTGNNRVGVQWRAALVNSGIGGKTQLADGDGTGGTISDAEKTLVASGAVFEVVEQFATHPGETAAQLRGRIDARHVEIASQVQAELQARLTYFGYTRIVP